VSDFLHAHSAYELIPESGKVVLLDLDLPIRQAFHALHEQVGGMLGAQGGRGSSSSKVALAAHDTSLSHNSSGAAVMCEQHLAGVTLPVWLRLACSSNLRHFCPANYQGPYVCSW
jgi:hypothetical protein